MDYGALKSGLDALSAQNPGLAANVTDELKTELGPRTFSRVMGGGDSLAYQGQNIDGRAAAGQSVKQAANSDDKILTVGGTQYNYSETGTAKYSGILQDAISQGASEAAIADIIGDQYKGLTQEEAIKAFGEFVIDQHRTVDANGDKTLSNAAALDVYALQTKLLEADPRNSPLSYQLGLAVDPGFVAGAKVGTESITNLATDYYDFYTAPKGSEAHNRAVEAFAERREALIDNAKSFVEFYNDAKIQGDYKATPAERDAALGRTREATKAVAEGLTETAQLVMQLERDSQRGSKFADGVLSGKITELTVAAFATRGAARAVSGSKDGANIELEIAAKGDDAANAGKNAGEVSNSVIEKGFIRFSDDVDQHIIFRDMSVPRRRGIGGAHNLNEFMKHSHEYNVVSRTPHPTLAGISKIEYRLFVKDAQGQLTNTLQSRTFEKTVYDPAIISNSEILQWGREAAAEAQSRGLLQREWQGVASNGLAYHGYLDNSGAVRTYFPDF